MSSKSTQASDLFRVHFHAITERDITPTGCRQCWEEVVFMLGTVATPAEILAPPHDCPAPWTGSQILAQELIDHPEKW
ncbi:MULTISPECIES: hypothetical protein [unclassified Arthrobacter]|uniref:hypothetical protein n=1 Tax=unclassified Arthrobacter TaxID=235627 RepID=UPI001492CF6E|nr:MULTISPECIES: hypothetical protein [unclassified Arthrobacter]MBE0010546.1 hypothetical protein [Arthrobacter sp. AET 35A]NOJ64354.1 hypothetical protein [Arthrobacter sp. 147(2020)]